MTLEGVEVAIVVKQFQVVNDAAGGDQRIDRLAHADPSLAQAPEISRRLDGKLHAAQRHDFEGQQTGSELVELALSVTALQYLGQDPDGCPLAWLTP